MAVGAAEGVGRVPVAIIGPGKIARDQHVPAIRDGGDFRLVAFVGDGSPLAGVPCFADVAALRREGPGVAAVAICTPPQVRVGLAEAAITAGWHVLLEKPPAPSVSEAEQLRQAGIAAGVTVLAGWHSRFAAQVGAARAWLAGRRIVSGRVSWREDVRVWHPGQHWLWQPGGMGVFDPAINALSILTAICPGPLRVAEAWFETPANAAAPIAARLGLATGGAAIAVDLDFLQEGPPSWDIALTTEDGAALLLERGGSVLSIDGVAVAAGPAAAMAGEYPQLYAHFATLIRAGASDCDLSPLRLVADAFMLARTMVVAPFSG